MLMRSTRSRSPNSVSARSCARWVFPTPVGPTKRKTPNGRRTFVNPDLMRPIIRTMVRTASLCPRRCPDRSVSIRDKSSGIAGSISIRGTRWRSEEHTSELQSLTNLVCRLLLEKKTSHALHEQQAVQIECLKYGGGRALVVDVVHGGDETSPILLRTWQSHCTGIAGTSSVGFAY